MFSLPFKSFLTNISASFNHWISEQCNQA